MVQTKLFSDLYFSKKYVLFVYAITESAVL